MYSNVCMCIMCVCTHVFLCASAPMRMCMCASVPLRVYLCAFVWLCMFLCVSVHLCGCVCVCMCMCAKCISIYLCVFRVQRHVQLCMHVCNIYCIVMFERLLTLICSYPQTFLCFATTHTHICTP